LPSGRPTRSFSAAPGADRSETTPVAFNPAGGLAATTSCRMTSLAPSLASRSLSLQPTMPAAPITRMRVMRAASPVGIPDAPPRHVGSHAALQVAALGKIAAHDALGRVAQVVHAEPVVGAHQDIDRFLGRRLLRIVADRVFRAVRRCYVGA